MLIRLMFKENPTIIEDISSDLQNISQSLRCQNSSSKDLEPLQSTRPELWLSSILLRIFSSASLESQPSLSNYLSGLDLIQVLLNSLEKFSFILEILYSTNGIFKNTLRIIQEIQASGSLSSFQVVLKTSLKFLEKVSKLRIPETFYTPQVFEVILSLCQKTGAFEKKLLFTSFKILKNLAGAHYLLYLESNGPEICVNILTELLNNRYFVEICKVLLELLVETLSFPETIKSIQGSSFMEALKPVASHQNFDLYPSMLNCLDLLIIENSLFISEIIQSHLAIQLLESFEVSVPCKLQLVEPLVKFLALLCSNFEGLQIVSRFSVITRVVEALIHSDEDLCSDFGVSIGEHLKKIISCVPTAVNKCVEGCLNVLTSFKESYGKYGFSVPGIGKVFKFCFCFTLEVVVEFFHQVSFEDLIEVIWRSAIEQASQLFWVFYSVKKLPECLLSTLMIRTIHSLCLNFYKLQQITGNLNFDQMNFEAMQISQYFPFFQGFKTVGVFPGLHRRDCEMDIQEVLINIEIHLEILKLILDASKAPSLHYQELSNCLINLGFLAKICIYESIKQNNYENESQRYLNPSPSSSIFKKLIEKIITFFSSCAHGCSMKPDKTILENSSFCILKNLGEILASLLREVEISETDLQSNQASSQVITFVKSVIFTPKTFTTSLLYSFYSALGMQNVYRLLGDLKNSFRNNDHENHLLKVMWRTNLDLLLALVKSADQKNGKGLLLLMSLGCSDAEAFIKELKVEVLFYFKHNNFDQSSWFKVEFKKTELEVLEFFLEHFEEFFHEDLEKNEHFFLHDENRVKNCRNQISRRGFFISLEEIADEIFEFSLKNDELAKKAGEVLLKVSQVCKLMQKNILEALNNELQISLIDLDEDQVVLKRVKYLLSAVFLQQKTCSDFLVTFEINAVSFIKVIFEKVKKISENLHIFELVFQILTQSFDRNPEICSRLVDSLADFCKKLDFQVNQQFFQFFFEFLAKICENVEIVGKFSEVKFFESILQLKKSSGITDKSKEFSVILLKFYENKSVLKNFYRKEIEILLKNQKVSLQHFLSHFSEGLLNHKDIFLQVFYETCYLESIFVRFSQVPPESLQAEEIISGTYKCLYQENPIVKHLGLVQSLIKVLKKHPSSSYEIFSFYFSKNFDFFQQIVIKQVEVQLNDSNLNISCNFPSESETNYWLKTCLSLLKLLLLQKNEDFNSKVFTELEFLFNSSLITEDLITCKVSNYFLQQFLQSHELKDLQFYRDLLSFYVKIGGLLTKINLKPKKNSIFFNCLLESFELLKSSSVSFNEQDLNEEEMVQDSESSEESEVHQIQVQGKSDNSDASLLEDEENDSKDFESCSDHSSLDSFQASLQENSFRKIDTVQRVELEILEFFSNESRPLIAKSYKPGDGPEPIRCQKIEKEVNLCLSPQLSKQVFQVLIKSLSNVQDLNEKVASLVFLQYLQNDYIWKNVITALAELLVVDSFDRDFVGKAEHAYCNLSIRVLNILNHMVSLSLSAALILVGKSAGFVILIRLFQNPLFQNSYFHLNSLVKLFFNITNKLGTRFPALTEQVLSSITGLMASPVLPDSTSALLAGLLSQISRLPTNRSTTLTCVTDSLRKLVDVPNLFSSLGVNLQKQLRILQLCKLLKSLGGCVETIDHVWESLSEVLLSSGPKFSLIRFIPIIESFLICHQDRASSASFKIFSLKTQKLLNSLIKQHPSLLLSNFKSLVSRFPSLLDFENKRNYFRAEMRKLQQDASHDVIRLHVRRQEVFMDSYHQLKDREPEELCCKIRIQFVGEEGLDAGGLTREWYSLLARAMFNANSALFIPSANGVSFQPNSSSLTNKEHIELFKFVGRIIGKALFDGHPLDLYFTRSFYKHILGQEVNYQDMEDLDLDFYKSLKSLMDINLNESELHEYYFAYEEEEFGIHKIKELVPGGRTKRVTEENKIDYIKLLCHMKMTKNIQAQIDAFKSGFQELIPVELVSIFGSKELELLISGLPEVDLEDLRNNTDYHNYTHESQVIIWLWEVLYEFSHEERAEFIQFVTGSSKVPLEGFKALPGLGGTQKFQIHKSFTSDDRLPTAHTCMNQLDLPEYQTKEKLKNRLKIAISEGKEGFGFI